jgi:uncharacterized protein (DUF1697 family)
MIYVVLLRGINVGGVKMPMADLKISLSKLGLSDIKTYLASGNLSFRSSLEKSDLKRRIEQTLSQDFTYSKEIFIYRVDELIDIIDKYPFESRSGMYRYVIFSLNQDTIERLAALAEDLNLIDESFKKGDGVLYWCVSVGQTLESSIGKLTANKAFKDQLTTRNLQTLDKIKSFTATLN